MTHDAIMRMAIEAGFQRDMFGRGIWDSEEFNRFHAIAIAAEREACAKLCEELGVHPALNVFNGGPEWYKHGKDCAAAIRARGEV